MATTPKTLGLEYIPRKTIWTGTTGAEVVPADAKIFPDYKGQGWQTWDIGTIANWWRVRRNPVDGTTYASRVAFP